MELRFRPYNYLNCHEFWSAARIPDIAHCSPFAESFVIIIRRGERHSKSVQKAIQGHLCGRRDLFRCLSAEATNDEKTGWRLCAQQLWNLHPRATLWPPRSTQSWICHFSMPLFQRIDGFPQFVSDYHYCAKKFRFLNGEIDLKSVRIGFPIFLNCFSYFLRQTKISNFVMINSPILTFWIWFVDWARFWQSRTVFSNIDSISLTVPFFCASSVSGSFIFLCQSV